MMQREPSLSLSESKSISSEMDVVEESKKAFKWRSSELKAAKSISEFNKRFILGKIIGSGGDGEVYEATTKGRNDWWAAVKKINISSDCDHEWVEFEIKCAQQERKLLGKAKIANIYDIYYDSINRIIYKVYDRYNYPLDEIIFNLQPQYIQSGGNISNKECK
eukprot:71809_1